MKQTIKTNRKKTWRSAAAKRLVTLAGDAPTVQDAIIALAKEHLTGVKHPPTDLDSLAAKLGITGFEAADIAGSGELRKEGQGFKIFYSNYLSPESARFTVAHEMCHALLEGTGSHAPRSGKELERLCDMFAAELLMPRELFIEHARGEISAQRILSLARYFRTSVAATGIRYAELCEVSVFAFQDSRVVWGSGAIRPRKQGIVDDSLLPSIRRALDGEANSDVVFLSSSDSMERWHIECHPLSRGKSALCLLRPVGKLTFGATDPARNGNAIPRLSRTKV